MRIALLHTRYARAGGVEKYIASLADRLLIRGHEVHYFSHGPSPGATPPDGLLIHRVPMLRWPEAMKHLAHAYLTRSAVRLASRRTPFDVVHGFSSTFEQDVYTDGSGAAAELPLFSGARLSAVKRFAPRRLVAIHLERRRYRAPGLRKVLAMSGLVREAIVRRHSLPGERIEVLPPPVDLEEFHPRHREGRRPAARRAASTPESSTVLLFVGSGFARKGLDLLIEAMALARMPGWVLWVLGRDRRRRSFERLARRRGVETRFLGFSPETARLYAGADAFALPSRYDAFGAAALEAMAAGLPVVVSSRAGVSELVEDGRSGLILQDLEGPGELSNRLLSLRDPGLRSRLGSGALEVAARAGWEEHLVRVLEAYRHAASGS